MNGTKLVGMHALIGCILLDLWALRDHYDEDVFPYGLGDRVHEIGLVRRPVAGAVQR